MIIFRTSLWLVLSSSLCFGQTGVCTPNWILSAGSTDRDWATSLKEAPNGDIFMIGYTKSFVTFPPAQRNMVWAARLTPAGTPLWQRQFGTLGFADEARAMVVTDDGSLVLAGFTDRFRTTRNTDGWIVKLSGDGNILWQKLFGATGADSVAHLVPTADGGFVACGASTSWTGQPTNADIWVFKISANGDLQWSYTYGGSESDSAREIRQTGDGGYVVGGVTESFGANGVNWWVLKLNSPGFIQWQYRFENDIPAVLETLCDTGEGDTIFAGRQTVMRLDELGQIVWQKAYPGAFFQSATPTNDGHITLAGGYFAPNFDFPDIGIHKIDLDGNPVWRKRYAINGDEWNHSISEATDGSLLLANYATGLGNSTDAWLFRLKSDGRAYLESSLNISDIVELPSNQTMVSHTTDAVHQNATFLVTNTNSIPDNIAPIFTSFAGCSFQGASEDWPCVTVLDIVNRILFPCP